MYPIDFVLIWVDGNDPKWQQEHLRYATNSSGDKSFVRFRDWENLKYWFRGVEKFTPWVNKIHFVTCGQVPDWLNLNASKLNFVKHSDFIPKEYLPTFSSHSIELNLHKINGLSEHFVYFNDDFFIINEIKPECFFRYGLPCDVAALDASTGIPMNCTDVINKRFDKRRVIKSYYKKWFSLTNRRLLFRTLCLMPWPYFAGFYVTHLPQPFLKSVFEEVWKEEHDILHETCCDKFRKESNVCQYIFRDWQLVTNKFTLYNTKKLGRFFSISEKNINEITKMIRNQTRKIIVINDSDNIENFFTLKQTIINSFNEILPNKSSFEL